jgi:amino acid transporter
MNGLVTSKANFGTAPVFLTAISTILGAVMFLRFGYAVGSVGFVGTLVIILIGHLVTIPTAMAIAEIATNQKVEGGGEYYIISRSFGINIGASIGVALYMSQAISVAFYIIAFAEAFDPVIAYLSDEYGFFITDKRLISIPALLALAALMLTKGANIGMKALYIVVATLFISLLFFFLGSTEYNQYLTSSPLNLYVENGDGFFIVFAIIFPAFTGMTAGVGLSGDLKDPKKSIPWGTVSATLIGMIIYVFIAYKLAISASPEELVSNQLVMSMISIWGPIIPIGLAAATILRHWVQLWLLQEHCKHWLEMIFFHLKKLIVCFQKKVKRTTNQLMLH